MSIINLSEMARLLGQKGGQNTFKKHGSDYYRELQKKAVIKRVANRKAVV